ncbi:MAG: hypothetical protein MHMPM18_004631 [Marteilia pararefringens]
MVELLVEETKKQVETPPIAAATNNSNQQQQQQLDEPLEIGGSAVKGTNMELLEEIQFPLGIGDEEKPKQQQQPGDLNHADAFQIGNTQAVNGAVDVQVPLGSQTNNQKTLRIDEDIQPIRENMNKIEKMMLENFELHHQQNEKITNVLHKEVSQLNENAIKYRQAASTLSYKQMILKYKWQATVVGLFAFFIILLMIIFFK